MNDKPRSNGASNNDLNDDQLATAFATLSDLPDDSGTPFPIPDRVAAQRDGNAGRRRGRYAQTVRKGVHCRHHTGRRHRGLDPRRSGVLPPVNDNEASAPDERGRTIAESPGTSTRDQSSPTDDFTARAWRDSDHDGGRVGDQTTSAWARGGQGCRQPAQVTTDHNSSTERNGDE